MCCGAAAFYTFLCVWGWHGETVGPAGGRVGTAPPDWGPSDSSPKPAPWQGAQPSQSPPSLLWVKEGWREQVGGRTDVPVPESLTPSREPSAYMKGEQAPPSWLEVAPQLGGPPGLCRRSGHAVWGRNASFCQRLHPPSCMARVLVGLLTRCMLLLAQPGHGPPSPAPLGAPSTRYTPAPMCSQCPAVPPIALHQAQRPFPLPAVGCPAWGWLPSLHGQAVRGHKDQQA